MTIDYFIEKEKEGTIFCKIGKSSINVKGSGGNFPYEEYIGKIAIAPIGNFTFETLEEVVKYLHYGDTLVILNFSEHTGLLPKDEYRESNLIEECYHTTTMYIENVFPFTEINTVDFIFNNTRNINAFVEYCDEAMIQLRKRKLFKAANRWKELATSLNV